MADMVKVRVTVDVVVNLDTSAHPEDWDFKDLFSLYEDDGESVEVIKLQELDRWESDDDDDDEPECPYSVGDRIHVISSTSTLEDHLGLNAIDAARIAGKTGSVVVTDPGDDYDVKIELDNGETTWINSEHLAMHVELEG